MKCFLGTVEDVTKQKIESLFQDKNYGEAKTFIQAKFQRFCLEHREDMDDVEKTVDTAIKAHIQRKEFEAEKETGIKPLKKGNPAEIIANRAKLREQKPLKSNKK